MDNEQLTETLALLEKALTSARYYDPASKTETTHLVIRVPVPLKQVLDQMAKDGGCTVSEVARSALYKELGGYIEQVMEKLGLPHRPGTGMALTPEGWQAVLPEEGKENVGNSTR